MSKTKGELHIKRRDGMTPIIIRGTLPQIIRATTRAAVSLNIELEQSLVECMKMFHEGEGLDGKSTDKLNGTRKKPE